ncbi:macro domain-containing protein [Calderihabitans maritimus]|uniref:Phosphatase n=1 Tax=Calderihabitans maritimus TaxID=1246530 RepID=A0A1Z5HXX2_9FIRM|nr:macro domain-containing protein [Calderihabitans maritimus]GAW94268.1 phosphatase [Calderihabitans maritimus]
MELEIKGKRVRIIRGDITDQEVEAVVNAANNHLWMGAGVAGAIKKKGGTEIEEEAVRKGPIPVGEAVVTGAGRLKAKYVIHAAGMGQDLRTDGNKIRLATTNSLQRAAELGLKSVAFPAIGTGVGGFPAPEAARVMLEVITEHLKGDTSLEEVRLVLFDETTYQAFLEQAGKYTS